MPYPRNNIRWNGMVKVAPAIADLQAIEAQIEYSFDGASGATGTITKNSGAVPGGKLWVLNHAIMWNDSGLLTLAQIILKSTTTEMKIMIGTAPAERVLTTFTGNIVMKPTEYVRFVFHGVPANDHTLVCTMRGYQVDQY